MGRIANFFFGKKGNVANVEKEIQDLKVEENLGEHELRLSTDLASLIIKEFAFNRNLVEELRSALKNMMNRRNISEKLNILNAIKNNISETPQKDKFDSILASLRKNLESQREKMRQAKNDFDLLPQA